MATLKSVMNTKTQPGPAYAPASGGEVTKATAYYDEITLPAGAANGDVIEFGPPNALKLNDRWKSAVVDCEDLGAGVTLSLGDDGSATRYMAAKDASAAARYVADKVAALGYQLTQDRPLRVTIGGANPTAGKKVRLLWELMRN